MSCHCTACCRRARASTSHSPSLAAQTLLPVSRLCSVEGGPTYEIALSGEASLINYFLDVTEIDCGLQVPHASLGRGPCLGTVAGALLPT